MVKTLFKAIIGIVLLIAFAVIVTGCFRTGDLYTKKEEEPLAQGPLKVGVILPLTGNAASYGIPMRHVAEIALSKVNAQGGVSGRPLEFIWEDGKCEGPTAAAAAQKLIDIDKVRVILGGFCSSETLAIAPIAEQAKVIVFSSGSSSPDITNSGDYIFRNYPSDASQGVILGTLASQMGLKKAGLLTEQNDYTVGISTVFRSTFEASGGTVVEETFLPEDKDFRTQILKLKSENVDMIFINPQTPVLADQILRQMQEQNITLTLFANDVVLGWQEGITRYKDYVEGMIGAQISYVKDHPEFIALVDEYKNRTGEAEIAYPTYSATTYDAVMILAEALRTVGEDPGMIKNYLYGIKDRDGVSGSLTIDKNGDPETGHRAEIVRGGVTVPYTSETSEASSQGEESQDVTSSQSDLT